MTIRQSGFKDTKSNAGAFGGGFPLVPEGTYWVVLKKVEEKESGAGNPMVKVRWMILDQGDFLGKLIFDNIVFCDKMAGRNKHLLKVLEQPYEEEKGEDLLDIEPDNWIGQEARVVVIHEEYKGKMQAKVSQYLYKNEDAEKAAHGNKASLKNKPVPATKKKEDPAPVESAADGNPQTEGEEIPF